MATPNYELTDSSAPSALSKIVVCVFSDQVHTHHPDLIPTGTITRIEEINTVQIHKVHGLQGRWITLPLFQLCLQHRGGFDSVLRVSLVAHLPLIMVQLGERGFGKEYGVQRAIVREETTVQGAAKEEKITIHPSFFPSPHPGLTAYGVEGNSEMRVSGDLGTDAVCAECGHMLIT